MAAFSFDATTVEPDAGMSPIPAGTYLAQIIESNIKPTKNGTGHYLQATWKVLDGQYKGRLIFDRINVKNASQAAEQIGQKQLSALCHAVGVLRLQDSIQLHNRPARVRVVVREDEQYGDGNEVKGYEPAGVQGMPAAAPQPAPFAPQPAFAQPAQPAAPAFRQPAQPAPFAQQPAPWAGQAPAPQQSAMPWQQNA
jgi:hypothetical protein